MLAVDPIWLFLDKLEKEEMNYFVTGSIASIFYGEPRLTHDIDLVLNLSNNDVYKFEKLFPLNEFYCPPDEIIQIELRRNPYGHFNLIHHKTGFKADVYLVGTDKLHEWAMEHKRRISFSPTQSLWLAPPEYVIIRKLEFYRDGGSDKHLRDIQAMLNLISNDLNHDFLNQALAERQLSTYWQKFIKNVP